MRHPKSPDGVPQPYNADLCRATRRLRTRLRAAEARIDALDAQLRAERAAIADERAALVAQMESPEAERDVMLIAQDLLREEVMSAATRREICRECGGLGHGMTKGLLSKRIADHCRVHDLPLTPKSGAGDPDAVADWPQVGAGHRRKPDWLRDPPGRKRRDVSIW